MDNRTVVERIMKNLAFEVEDVPKNKTDATTSSKIDPLNVKIRVRKKETNELFGPGFISNNQSEPEMVLRKIRLINSDETIMSFDMFMEADLEKKPSRKPRRHLFDKLKPGLCLGGTDDDKSPYMPDSSYSTKNTEGSSLSKSDGILRQQFPLSKNTRNTFLETAIPRREKSFLGKRCKPGGCLDPPFGEDKYSYKPSVPIDPIIQNPKEFTKITTNDIKPDYLDENSEKKKIKSKDTFIKPMDTVGKETDSILSIYKGDTVRNSVITYPPGDENKALRTRLPSRDKRGDEGKFLRSRPSSEIYLRHSINESKNSFFSPPKGIKRDSNFLSDPPEGASASKVLKNKSEELILKAPIPTTQSSHSISLKQTANLGTTEDIKLQDKLLKQIKDTLSIPDYKVNEDGKANLTIIPLLIPVSGSLEQGNDEKTSNNIDKLDPQDSDSRTKSTRPLKIMDSTFSLNTNQGTMAPSIETDQQIDGTAVTECVPTKLLKKYEIKDEEMITQSEKSSLPLDNTTLVYYDEVPLTKEISIYDIIKEIRTKKEESSLPIDQFTKSNDYHNIEEIDHFQEVKEIISQSGKPLPPICQTVSSNIENKSLHDKNRQSKESLHSIQQKIISNDYGKAQETISQSKTSLFPIQQPLKGKDYDTRQEEIFPSKENHLPMLVTKNTNDNDLPRDIISQSERSSQSIHQTTIHIATENHQEIISEPNKSILSLYQTAKIDDYNTRQEIKPRSIGSPIPKHQSIKSIDCDNVEEIHKIHSIADTSQFLLHETSTSKDYKYRQVIIPQSEEPLLSTHITMSSDSDKQIEDQLLKPKGQDQNYVNDKQNENDQSIDLTEENKPDINQVSLSPEHSIKKHFDKYTEIIIMDSKNKTIGTKVEAKFNLAKNKDFDDEHKVMASTESILWPTSNNDHKEFDSTIHDEGIITLDGVNRDASLKSDFLSLVNSDFKGNANSAVISKDNDEDNISKQTKSQTVASKINKPEKETQRTENISKTIAQITETGVEINSYSDELIIKPAMRSENRKNTIRTLGEKRVSLNKGKKKSDTLQWSNRLNKKAETDDSVKEKPFLSSDISSTSDFSTVFLNLAFHSYFNNKNQRILKTVDPGCDIKRYSNDSLTIIKSQIKLTSEKTFCDINISVDSTLDMDIKIKKTYDPVKTIQDKNKTQPIRNLPEKLRVPKDSVQKVQHKSCDSEKAHRTLTDIYEQELIPLQMMMRDLKDEVDALTVQQTVLKKKAFVTYCPKKPKAPRPVHFNKGCSSCKP